MQEKTVEAALRRAVEAEGGLCLKWVCPGHKGVPDRILLFPGGIITFVELKRPGAKVKAGGLQEWWGKKLRELGFPCYEVSDVYAARTLAADLSMESRTLQLESEELVKDWACEFDDDPRDDEEDSGDRPAL